MNKIFNFVMLLTCLFISACSDDNEPEAVTPIHFEKSDYTVMFGKYTRIPFTGGGGVYELTASKPEVLGKFGIDTNTPEHYLYIQPTQTGESSLTIKDIKSDTTITLHFIVEDFYLSFRIDEVDGTNDNEFFDVGREIRFIRNEDNTKPVQVIKCQNMTFVPVTVGEGIFNISRSNTNIFTLEFSLHHKSNDEFALYEYTIEGDVASLSLFDSIFDFAWEKAPTPRSSATQPINTPTLTLTAKNGCKITCRLVNV